MNWKRKKEKNKEIEKWKSIEVEIRLEREGVKELKENYGNWKTAVEDKLKGMEIKSKIKDDQIRRESKTIEDQHISMAKEMDNVKHQLTEVFQTISNQTIQDNLLKEIQKERIEEEEKQKYAEFKDKESQKESMNMELVTLKNHIESKISKKEVTIFSLAVLFGLFVIMTLT